MSEYNGPKNEELDRAKKVWGLGDIDLNFIRGNENWVYEYKDLIFRFTANYHCSIEELDAELNWISYLGSQGLSVSVPVSSTNHRLIEEISDVWSCVVFKKAEGEQLLHADKFTKEVFLSWGKLTGAIHRATKNYIPGVNRRHQWDEDDGYLLSQKALKETDPSHTMAIQYVDLLSKLRTYEKSSNGYGLIHGDFHHGNFHYDRADNQITLFDFDDSNYFWYAFDLVVPFASLELSKHFRGLELDYTDLQKYFMEAYQKEYDLDSYWLDELPVFMKYRFVSLYFWSKGRSLNSRVNSDDSTKSFMGVCEKLASEV